MLQPKKTKYRRRQKGRMRGRAERGSSLAFGTYGLQATSCGFITARQVEAARVAITRHIKRGGKVWIRIFPDKPLTAKPTETRMGKGKGNTTDWVVVIKPGRIMYELEGVTPEVAQEAVRLAGHKLPVGTRFVSEEA